MYQVLQPNKKRRRRLFRPKFLNAIVDQRALNKKINAPPARVVTRHRRRAAPPRAVAFRGSVHTARGAISSIMENSPEALEGVCHPPRAARMRA
jgi:hypothetical protein